MYEKIFVALIVIYLIIKGLEVVAMFAANKSRHDRVLTQVLSKMEKQMSRYNDNRFLDNRKY